MIESLAASGVQFEYLGPDARVGPDSVYVRDAAVVCRQGIVLCNMSKEQRRLEPGVLGEALGRAQLHVHGAITGDGRLEGGDVAWVDSRCLAVGRSRRTNAEGIRQLRELLADCVDEVVEVPLPPTRVPGDVFHLMSIFSPVADDLALVYTPLLPASFRDLLLARDVRLVEVPDDEFDSMGCNVLAVAPRHVIVVAGNPRTRRRLEKHGVQVVPLQAGEICLKGAGGPTCLTRPLMRG